MRPKNILRHCKPVALVNLYYGGEGSIGLGRPRDA